MNRKTVITLLIGILIGVLLVLVSRPVGRYQVSARSQGFAVVDTTTGRVWARSGDTLLDFGTPRNPKNKQSEVSD